MTTDWQSRACSLTRQLVHTGALDKNWRDAFQSVPRHIFVPRYYRPDMTPVDSSEPHDRKEWLDTVYSDESLTTQCAPVPGTDLIWPTSSSTKPSLMARMLTLLDVRTGHHVLEIGTGTGYNAALLCYRLGDRHVASIDIDPTLVTTARLYLADIGQHPTLETGDGAAGVPAQAPYDRIIATCAIPEVPDAWIRQLRDSGLIVTDLRGELASNLVVLRKISPTTVEGRFLPIPGHFMWLRPHSNNPLRDDKEFLTPIDHDGAIQRRTQLDPAILDHPDLRFLLQARDPTIQTIWRTHRANTELLSIHCRDGAWAEAQTTDRNGQHTVTQGGPRPIWDLIEDTASYWSRRNYPHAERFGVTATTGGHPQLWLDTPDVPAFTENP